MIEEQKLELLVPEEMEDPIRLDQYLAAELSGQLADFTRSRIQKLIDEGKVEVDEKPGKAGAKLRGGEAITIVVPADVPLEVKAQEIPLNIVFEDADLIVVNKPAGMVTHPGAGVTEGTLVNALLYHCGSSLSGISGVLRPGIVHRLDKDTSGLLVVAKSNRAHHALAEQIKRKDARRIYQAILEGVPAAEQGTVDKPIGRHPVERKKMAITESGRNARTHWQVLRHWHKFCLVKCTLDTGRTHQIRVHMNSLGTPVVGDIVYNRKTTGTPEARRRLGLAGH
ncbi:MAG TPA: RluA family pseudouridine synthase, partial [Candidatus Obscuribacterales bacterium]